MERKAEYFTREIDAARSLVPAAGTVRGKAPAEDTLATLRRVSALDEG